MTSASAPSAVATLIPSDDDESLLHTVLVGGLPELYLGDQHLPVGARLELHRAGRWHSARVTLSASLQIRVEVLSPRWPGAPCALSPDDVELVAARAVGDGCALGEVS